MAGIKPPIFANASSTFPPNFAAKTKNPLGFAAPAGYECFVLAKLLCTLHSTRRLAVMMMPVRVVRKNHEEAG
jgi:hypothetical protein